MKTPYDDLLAEDHGMNLEKLRQKRPSYFMSFVDCPTALIWHEYLETKKDIEWGQTYEIGRKLLPYAKRFLMILEMELDTIWPYEYFVWPQPYLN